MKEENKNRFLKEVENAGKYGILRKNLPTNEIKIANKLVKDGLIYKGHFDDKQHTLTYFIIDMKEENKNTFLTELENSGEYGILRKFLSKNEIKIANQLVKDGLIYKGKSDDKQHTVTYFIK